MSVRFFCRMLARCFRFSLSPRLLFSALSCILLVTTALIFSAKTRGLFFCLSAERLCAQPFFLLCLSSRLFFRMLSCGFSL
jgi:hypothetical protein